MSNIFGEYESALSWIKKILDHVNKTGSHALTAELFRIKGLTLQAVGKPKAIVEKCFKKALELSREQSAKTFELRAAGDMAKLWKKQGKTNEAYELLEGVFSWFTEGFAKRRPEVLDQVRAWVAGNDASVYPALYLLLAEAEIGLETSIADIQCPALVMTGEDDAGNSPQMAQQMAAIMPNARLEILPGLRHLALAENPAAVNDLLVPFLRDSLQV